ncbi:MAG TPA: non-homologous end-joining DNA ligase [Candidatus Binatia bacterium]
MKTSARAGGSRLARTASEGRTKRAKKTSAAKTSAEARLATYRAKRRFEKTPEPSGDGKAARKRKARGPLFVIQKHAARNLHYDFRLEHDGVLWSWSVPKGPSLDPKTRRLAVRTEDHPLEYADFEGIIPAGEYGGGTVVVWDRGTWTPEGDPAEALRRGRLTFELHGEKLHGRWHLVRTRGPGRDADRHESWLLFKGRDEAASERTDIVQERPESVATGRTLEEVGEARDRLWHSNRQAAEQDGGTRVKKKRGAKDDGAAAEEGGQSLFDLVRALPVDVKLTNLDKVLYPEAELTKAALIAYFAVVADRLLEHAGRRPLTLVRCPDGHHKQCFFQKHAREGHGIPKSIRRVPIPEDDGVAQYMMIEDLEGLIALAQLGTLEIHHWGCHADQIERPDLLVMDIDPDPELPWQIVVETAFELRRRLHDLGLESFVKTTGGKGLHVVAPVARRIGWDDFKAFAKAIADRLAADQPELYTTNPAKAGRKRKILIDYLRNGRGATAVAAYSPRARPYATVATPVSWDELERGVDPKEFTITTLPRFLGERPDPWAGWHDVKQSITAAARKQLGMR